MPREEPGRASTLLVECPLFAHVRHSQFLNHSRDGLFRPCSEFTPLCTLLAIKLGYQDKRVISTVDLDDGRWQCGCGAKTYNEFDRPRKSLEKSSVFSQKTPGFFVKNAADLLNYPMNSPRASPSRFSKSHTARIT